VLCDELIEPNRGICTACEPDLPRLKFEICQRCGREKEECMCSNFRYYYEGIYAPFYYEGKLAKSIRNFKFNANIQNAHFFADEIASYLKKQIAVEEIDLITCVPLSKKSMKARGYNQSALLAKELAQSLDLIFSDKIILKIYETPAQHTLSVSHRRGNLAGVFELGGKADIKGKTVLLCDDIATTGTTINECAKMLLLGGAHKVYCATVAVTKRRR
jgi:ComF family protein